MNKLTKYILENLFLTLEFTRILFMNLVLWYYKNLMLVNKPKRIIALKLLFIALELVSLRVRHLWAVQWKWRICCESSSCTQAADYECSNYLNFVGYHFANEGVVVMICSTCHLLWEKIKPCSIKYIEVDHKNHQLLWAITCPSI